jgi:hypothetical protein
MSGSPLKADAMMESDRCDVIEFRYLPDYYLLFCSDSDSNQTATDADNPTSLKNYIHIKTEFHHFHGSADQVQPFESIVTDAMLSHMDDMVRYLFSLSMLHGDVSVHRQIMK